ncbi:MAG: hypothetical protein EHM87_16115 [Burkholderiales bacterium]|nr:MAG: hypothetical protein EHM87_16115 [Burkholderiales bacterium]
MQIAGDGITTFTARILPEFRVRTKYALEWFQTSSGHWHYTDRGVTTDTYETEIKMHLLKGSVEELVYQLELNRRAGSNLLELSNFSSNEEIFGADVDYSGTINATLLGTPNVVQSRLKSYEVIMSLRAIVPAFVGTATFPTLKYLNIGYNANVDKYTINKKDSYTGAYTCLDMASDAAIFEGTFQFSDSEMRNIRRWLAINRGSTISIASIYGVDKPWGVNRSTGYPISAKLLEISGEEMRGVSNWYARLKLGEVL